MIKWLQHIIVLLLLIFGITTAVAQVAMPDTVCVGTPRLYHVNDASIPSTYTWKIDGVTQTVSGIAICAMACVKLKSNTADTMICRNL